MALLLWMLILALGVTGWMTRLDAFWGEGWLERLHADLAYVLLGCVAVHVSGVLVMSRLLHESLIAAMITGEETARRRRPEMTRTIPIQPGSSRFRLPS